MIELIRTNDTLFLSWLAMRFKQKAIHTSVFDAHMAVAGGLIPAIQCRLMVNDNDMRRARLIPQEVENLGDPTYQWK